MNDSVQDRKSDTCSSGTPIIRAMTTLGRMAANSCCSSQPPRSAISSRSSRAVLRTASSAAAMRRGVNARDTSARTAEWRGGSK